MKKKENINKESIKLMKEFHQKQIQTNIKLHIIFLISIVLVNIGLIFFIILYKIKISEIKTRTSNNSNSIRNNKDNINTISCEIDHKMVNIMANSYNGLYHFSFIFDTKKEVDTIKKYIIDFYKDTNLKLDIDKMNLNIIYQGIIDGDSFPILKERINSNFRTFFFVKTNNNNRFGFYSDDFVFLDKKNKHIYKDNMCFLISFQKEGLFKCIGERNKLEIIKNDDGMIIIGDGDIIIKNNYLQYNKGIINFPFKSFDISTINTNVFTEMDGEFQIINLEVFSVYFNMD